MKRRVWALGRRAAKRVAPELVTSVRDLATLQSQVKQLSRRVATLEAEVQESRRVNRRVAEVVDVVEEVLLPAANRDDERLRRALDKYAETL